MNNYIYAIRELQLWLIKKMCMVTQTLYITDWNNNNFFFQKTVFLKWPIYLFLFWLFSTLLFLLPYYNVLQIWYGINFILIPYTIIHSQFLIVPITFVIDNFPFPIEKSWSTIKYPLNIYYQTFTFSSSILYSRFLNIFIIIYIQIWCISSCQ